MTQNRTTSILQRFAVVLAVTAASYGLPQSQAQARVTSSGNSHSSSHQTPATAQQR